MKDYIFKQGVISLCLYVGQLLLGIAFGWSAPFNEKLQNPEETPLPDLVTDEQASWLGSIVYIGGIASPIVTGVLSNNIGRKPCMFIGGIINAAAVILVAAAESLTMLYCGRVLAGFGTATILNVNMIYIGEIASTNIRGILLTGTAVFTTLGIVVIYSVVPFVSYGVASYMQIAFSVLYIAGLFVVPESPMYHVIHGNEEKAVQIMVDLGRTDPNDINKVLSLKDEKTITFTSQWRELFFKKNNRKALFIVLSIHMFQQMSGAIAVIMFATRIFEIAGSTIAPYLATIIIGITQLVGASLAPIFVERMGRKMLLLSSCGITSLSLFTLGLYFYLDDNGHNMEVVGWLPLLTLVTFFLGFDTGLGIIPGALSGELFSSSARGTGAGLSLAVTMLVGFAVSTAFGYLITTFGASATFWLLSSICAVGFAFTMFFVPETRGKTLFEIQQMLSR